MIRLKFLFLLLVVLLTSSCSKDFSEEIVGTWVIESAEYSACPDAGILASTITASDGCLSYFGDNLCVTAIINEDGTGSFISTEDGTEYKSAVTYTVNSDTDIATICGDGECQEITLSDDKLVMTGEEEGCTITFNFIKS